MVGGKAASPTNSATGAVGAGTQRQKGNSQAALTDAEVKLFCSWQGEGNSTGVNKSWERNSLPLRPPGTSAAAGPTQPCPVLPNTWENH